MIKRIVCRLKTIAFKTAGFLESQFYSACKFSYCTVVMKKEILRYGLQVNQTIAIYGRGQYYRLFFKVYACLIGKPAANILLIDSFSAGNETQDGYPVINIQDINAYKIDRILFMSPKNRDEMQENVRTHSKRTIDSITLSPFFCEVVKEFKPRYRKDTDSLLVFDEVPGEHFYRKAKSGETFYIIRRLDHRAGLFSCFITAAGQIAYAVKKGYIPVVDMMNYANPYLPQDCIGRENAWEYYFEQPQKKGCLDAFLSDSSILMSGPDASWPNDSMSFFSNKNGIQDTWKALVKKYIRIRPDLLRQIEDEYCEMVEPDDVVLGISVRGTDYISKRPKNHPIQPEIQQVIADAKVFMKKYACTKVFIATEDVLYINVLKREFGDRIIMAKRSYIQYTPGEATPFVRIDRENDIFLQGFEYLKEIVMLSKSDYLVAGRTSGNVAAFLLSDGYKDFLVYDLGRYE